MRIAIKKIINNIFGSLLFCILFINGVHCRKSNPGRPKLPDISENGGNTFGCKLNGDVWVPNAACDNFGDPCAGMDVSVFRATPSDSLPLEITISVAQRNAGVTN